MPNTPPAFPYQITANKDLVWGGFQCAQGIGCGPTGAFEDISGTARYYPLLDVSASVIRMGYSVDNGQSWVELDSANHPAVATNSTGTFTGTSYQFGTSLKAIPFTSTVNYQRFNSVRNPTDRKLYSVYFDGSHNLALAPFDMAAGTWAATVTSGIKLAVDFPVSLGNNNSGIGVGYRDSDKCVWAAWVSAGTGHDGRYVYGAYCFPEGGGWGGTTIISGSAGDGTNCWLNGVSDADSSGRIHFTYSTVDSGRGAGGATSVASTNISGTNYTYVTGVSVTDGGTGYLDGVGYGNINIVPDTFGTFQFANVNVPDPVTYSFDVASTVVSGVTNSTGTTPAGVDGYAMGGVGLVAIFLAPSNLITGTLWHAYVTSGNALGGQNILSTAGTYMAPLRCYNDVLYTAYTIGSTIYTLRGTAAGSPSWEVLNDGNINGFGSSTLKYLMDFCNLGGSDYAFMGRDGDSGFNTVVYGYSLSTGIGGGWGTPTVVGTIDVSGSDFTDNRVVCMAYGTSATVALTTPYGTAFSGGYPKGQAYWEISSSTVVVASFLYFPQYTKRHNTPGH